MKAGQARTILLVVGVAALFTGVGLLRASTKVTAVRVGYELGRVELENRELEREKARLEMELKRASAGAKLEVLAKDRLGMVPIAPGRVISLDPSPRGQGQSAVASVSEEAAR